MSANPVGEMFDRISPTYDLLNRLLSLRRDVSWRCRVADLVCSAGATAVLDVATGTGDVALTLARRCPALTRVVGVDIAEAMLAIGRDKVAAARLAPAIDLQAADAVCLPFATGEFDAVTIAFGIRNVADYPAALAEMLRVLRPGGLVAVLEFSLPAGRLVRQAYLTYFRRILPAIGGLVSGSGSAYRYLNRTVEGFPYGERFLHVLRQVGFSRARALPLSFGIATIYLANAPAAVGR